MTENNTKGSNGIYMILIFILLAALGVLSYMWSSKRGELNDCTNENLILKSDMEGMNQMMKGYVGNLSSDLKTDFKNMLNTYDKLIEKDHTKADSLNKQKDKIQVLLNQLNSNKRLSANQLYKLSKENETLRGIMRSYVKQIDSLNTLNISLTSKLDETASKLTTTTVERDEFKKVAEEKTEQVKKGARLQAYQFNSVALRQKMNNTSEETVKAKNAVQIKSSFTIAQNPLTTAGKKTVYLQITNPEGKVLQARSSYTTDTDQGNVAYSDKKEIDYQNQAIDLSIYFDLKENAAKGNYKVRVICDGSVIGTDSFTLK